LSHETLGFAMSPASPASPVNVSDAVGGPFGAAEDDAVAGLDDDVEDDELELPPQAATTRQSSTANRPSILIVVDPFTPHYVRPIMTPKARPSRRFLCQLDVTGILGVGRNGIPGPPRGPRLTIHQLRRHGLYGVPRQQLLRREKSMTRADLVKSMADSTGMSQTDVDKVLVAFLDEVSKVVASGGEKLTIPGYLTFERAHRNARTGRNPQTGAPVDIPATHVAKVTVGSKLKAAAKG
jgi:DNA-binding protein HU-beta